VTFIVCVKQVAALDDEFEMLDDGTGVDPDFVERDLNEWDRFAVEAALQLRDATGEGEVVVVTVGDDEADEALLACLAMGADRAIRVWDDALETADALGVARVLAATLQSQPAELVLCGVQSSDAVNGATGVALAAYLGVPRVAVVRHLEYDPATRQVTVERELEGGLVEQLRVACPALLTVQTGINEPRYATLRAVKQAREKPLEVLDLDAVALGEAAVAEAVGSRTRALAHPEKMAGAEMLNGSPAELAARIAEIVREKVSA
jgi:electron transfer flavoprotein beta subunit